MIDNNSTDMVDAFKFDQSDYTKPRPLVEIRAGYSEMKIEANDDTVGPATLGGSSPILDQLKKDLSIVYAGHPFYLADSKTRGGRNLVVRLHDAGTWDLGGPLSRITERYPAGTALQAVLSALCEKLGAQTNFENFTSKGATRISSDLWYNNRLILSDIIPELSRNYGFYYFKKGDAYVFFPSGAQEMGDFVEISAANGLIEYPGGVNWTHYGFQTLFARPRFLQPGDWVKLKDPSFIRFGLSDRGIISGIVVSAQYSFEDEQAMCNFVMAPEGYPVESQPVIVI